MFNYKVDNKVKFAFIFYIIILIIFLVNIRSIRYFLVLRTSFNDSNLILRF